MREADDSGVPEQEVKARNQHDEDQHFCCHIDRLHSRHEKRSECKADDKQDEQHRKNSAARHIIRQQTSQHARHLFTTG